jgi:hypothetical protein
VTFVNNDELPVDLGQVVLISENHFIRRANDWKLGGRTPFVEVLLHACSEDLLAIIFGAVVHDHRDRRSPFVKFIHPVAERAERRNDQVRTKVVLLLTE